MIQKCSSSQLNCRWLFSLLLVLCCLPVYGQQPIRAEEIFAPVPAALRATLAERLNLLVDYQRKQQWERQYELLSSIYTQGDSKEEYASRNRHWYKDVAPDDLILDFSPKSTTVHEASPDTGWWTIYGCAKVRRKGHEEQLYATVDARREGGTWYFSTIGVITPIDGQPQRCPYQGIH